MLRIARHGATIAAVAVIGAAAVAGCSAGPSVPLATSFGGGFGAVPAAATGAQHAGTVTWAEHPGAAPTWILPLVTSAAYSVADISQFEFEMWRPLYWFGNGVEPTQTPAMSLASAPVWSNGDKTVTITLKSTYKWSTGQPVTARDVLFWFDEVKAAVRESPANWGAYAPGVGIPDQVASVTTRGARTVVFTMKEPVDPGWFLDDELSLVVPMPSVAWARASAGGPALDFTIPANATTIYNYLAAASKSLSTYATNPLWRVVDGPYTLTAFNASTGAFTLTPNRAYDGPHATKMSTVQAVPSTSVTAEFNAVRAGAVDVANIPLIDLKQVGALKASGYQVFGYPTFAFNYVAYNFLDKTGHFSSIIAQLYMRQAIAHLEDEQGYIKAFFGGAGGPAYGPVPALPKSPYTPADAVTDPYPFSVPAAISALKSHGWAVHPGGTDVCAKPGRGPGECGAGIPAGTRLAFNLIYITAPPFIGEMVTDLASQAAKAGITISLRGSSPSVIISNYDNPLPSGRPYVNKWAMEDFGGNTDSPYPTTLGIFNGTGGLNTGSYSNPTADKLINASVTNGNPAAVKAEAAFLTANQPGLFQPDPDYVVAWKKNLSGPPASFEDLTQYFLTPEYWYFTR
ncbi:MAG TPA: ABC transporter substrate-binding protein [Streptosporangiaceae bacterium]|nr:ABC transporter substrate-binding protein [Streptosporangiaceae bacterium]